MSSSSLTCPLSAATVPLSNFHSRTLFLSSICLNSQPWSTSRCCSHDCEGASGPQPEDRLLVLDTGYCFVSSCKELSSEKLCLRVDLGFGWIFGSCWVSLYSAVAQQTSEQPGCGSDVYALFSGSRTAVFWWLILCYCPTRLLRGQTFGCCGWKILCRRILVQGCQISSGSLCSWGHGYGTAQTGSNFYDILS